MEDPVHMWKGQFHTDNTDPNFDNYMNQTGPQIPRHSFPTPPGPTTPTLPGGPGTPGTYHTPVYHGLSPPVSGNHPHTPGSSNSSTSSNGNFQSTVPCGPLSGGGGAIGSPMGINSGPSTPNPCGQGNDLMTNQAGAFISVSDSGMIAITDKHNAMVGNTTDHERRSAVFNSPRGSLDSPSHHHQGSFPLSFQNVVGGPPNTNRMNNKNTSPHHIPDLQLTKKKSQGRRKSSNANSATPSSSNCIPLPPFGSPSPGLMTGMGGSSSNSSILEDTATAPQQNEFGGNGLLLPSSDMLNSNNEMGGPPPSQTMVEMYNNPNNMDQGLSVGVSGGPLPHHSYQMMMPNQVNMLPNMNPNGHGKQQQGILSPNQLPPFHHHHHQGDHAPSVFHSPLHNNGDVMLQSPKGSHTPILSNSGPSNASYSRSKNKRKVVENDNESMLQNVTTPTQSPRGGGRTSLQSMSSGGQGQLAPAAQVMSPSSLEMQNRLLGQNNQFMKQGPHGGGMPNPPRMGHSTGQYPSNIPQPPNHHHPMRFGMRPLHPHFYHHPSTGLPPSSPSQKGGAGGFMHHPMAFSPRGCFPSQIGGGGVRGFHPLQGGGPPHHHHSLLFGGGGHGLPSSRNFMPTLPSVDMKFHEMNRRLQQRSQQIRNSGILDRPGGEPMRPDILGDSNLWWDGFSNEFFNDDARILLSFCMENGPRKYNIGRVLIARYFRSMFEGGVAELRFDVRNAKESLHHSTVTMESDHFTMIATHTRPTLTQVHTEGRLIVDFALDDMMRIRTWNLAIRRHREFVPRSSLPPQPPINSPNPNSVGSSGEEQQQSNVMVESMTKNITRQGMTSATLNYLRLCVILEPMQELMSRYKTLGMNPRECLKTTLYQKWQKTVSPTETTNQTATKPATKRRKRKNASTAASTSSSSSTNSSSTAPRALPSPLTSPSGGGGGVSSPSCMSPMQRTMYIPPGGGMTPSPHLFMYNNGGPQMAPGGVPGGGLVLSPMNSPSSMQQMQGGLPPSGPMMISPFNSPSSSLPQRRTPPPNSMISPPLHRQMSPEPRGTNMSPGERGGGPSCNRLPPMGMFPSPRKLSRGSRDYPPPSSSMPNASQSGPSTGQLHSNSGANSSMFSLTNQEVMIVGEPSLMGGDFGGEDERVITRLENQRYDSPPTSSMRRGSDLPPTSSPMYCYNTLTPQHDGQSSGMTGSRRLAINESNTMFVGVHGPHNTNSNNPSCGMPPSHAPLPPLQNHHAAQSQSSNNFHTNHANSQPLPPPNQQGNFPPFPHLNNNDIAGVSGVEGGGGDELREEDLDSLLGEDPAWGGLTASPPDMSNNNNTDITSSEQNSSGGQRATPTDNSSRPNSSSSVVVRRPTPRHSLDESAPN